MSDKRCTKRPYVTRLAARQALLAIWSKKRLRTERSTYLCNCGAWHLTSRKRRRP